MNYPAEQSTMNASRHRYTLIALFVISLAVYTLAALPMNLPDTMDSFYYYGTGSYLLQQGKLEEPFIWNYLADPESVPTPSHLYWMPLPSFLVAASQWLFGYSFRASQVPFVLAAAFMPLIGYGFGWLIAQRQNIALLTGGFVLLAGYYLPQMLVPETFSPFGILGGIALLTVGYWYKHHRFALLIIAGLCAGGAHLTRSDGLLVLFALVAAMLWHHRKVGTRKAISAIALLVLGYSLVMAPWFVRNWTLIGSPLSSAGTKTMFLRHYDELFSFGTVLSWQRYFSWGWNQILISKLGALWLNFQSFAAVNNLIILTPFTLIGLWKFRRKMWITPVAIYTVALYSVMTIFFTFPGVRGGVFHSSIALFPAFCALALAGLEAAIEWIAERRPQWNQASAFRFFSSGFLVIVLVLTAFLYLRRVVGSGTISQPAWNQNYSGMDTIGNLIRSQEEIDPVVMVGDPPAFYVITGLEAIVAPNENLERTIAAARMYGATYILLDQDYPQPLKSLYHGYDSNPVIQAVPLPADPELAEYRLFRVLDASSQ
ncbi:MAG: hypothetical protein ABFQ89_00685 [Chloroflexota bacterium]